MKKWTLLTLLIGVFLIPKIGHANLDGFQLQFAVAWFEADDECGVQGEITSDQGGLINGSERLTLNGVTWGDFSSLPLSGYSVGDKIAFGTLKLEAKLNYNFDVILDENICKSLQAGDRVQFDGSFTQDLSSFDLIDPMIGYGLTWDAGNPLMIDLGVNSVRFTNLNGATVDVGSGPIIAGGGGSSGGGGTGGGCSLAAAASSQGLLAYPGFALLLGAGLWFRKKIR